ncbi:MAG: hypothetical protein ICV60_20625 [Pyrinomonadaceae bacterium]|nr:hypothetical protein [Pyrinomonadaceae bacterium]
MAATTRDSFTTVILTIAALLYGLCLGALLFDALVIGLGWEGAHLAEAVAWNNSLNQYYIPNLINFLIAGALAFTTLAWLMRRTEASYSRTWELKAAAFCALAALVTLAFAPVAQTFNLSEGAAAAEVEEVGRAVERWVLWSWLRTLFIAAGFLSTLIGLSRRPAQAHEATAGKKAHAQSHKWLYIFTSLGALVFLVLSRVLKDSHVIPTETARELLPELFRDLGIAFVVAILVTYIYETYSRSHYDRENFEQLLSTFVGEVFHPDIWDEIKDQIIAKSLIREDVKVELSLEELEGLPAGQHVLYMKLSYSLYGLRSAPQENVKLQHFLDKHSMDVAKDLPRFEKIHVGDKRYDTADAVKEKCADGTFTDVIPQLQPRNSERPIKIVTERRELAYAPGSYYLVMSELTKEATIELLQLPEDMTAEVEIWPHTDSTPLVKGTPWELKNHIVLPGQGFEFRFKRKPKEAAPPKPEIGTHLSDKAEEDKDKSVTDVGADTEKEVAGTEQPPATATSTVVEQPPAEVVPVEAPAGGAPENLEKKEGQS